MTLTVLSLSPSLLDLQHLVTWVGVFAGVAVIVLGVFWLIDSVRETLVRIYDEDAPRGVRLTFKRRAH